jgi:hypothetical protein
MDNENQFINPKDRMLWEIAKKRASFKTHLFTYIVVIGFLWALWAFTGREYPAGKPWPLWATLGWGIGIIFHYMGAYVFPKENSVEKEYEKLKNEQNK